MLLEYSNLVFTVIGLIVGSLSIFQKYRLRGISSGIKIRKLNRDLYFWRDELQEVDMDIVELEGHISKMATRMPDAVLERIQLHYANEEYIAASDTARKWVDMELNNIKNIVDSVDCIKAGKI